MLKKCLPLRIRDHYKRALRWLVLDCIASLAAFAHGVTEHSFFADEDGFRCFDWAQHDSRTIISISAEALGDFAIHAHHRGAARSVNPMGASVAGIFSANKSSRHR
jgi:hypothetical protein